jgi:hypothetical protein
MALMPFIVGSPRSGTTLVRLMLDSHPLLAIPPETHFIPALAALGTDGDLRDRFWTTITSFPPGVSAWGDFGLSQESFKAELARIEPFNVSDGLRCFYRAYAREHGKPAYGDKTPGYTHHLPLISALLPESAVIHVIRDGRDASLSLREMWFSPGNDIETQARHWRDNVLAARAGAASCARYTEVRLEDLLTRTEPELARLCAFLDMPFEPAMLRYFERAPQRLNEPPERWRQDGTLAITREARVQQQWRTTTPPDLTRIGQWRTLMPADEVRTFERVAGDLLRSLGYSG